MQGFGYVVPVNLKHEVVICTYFLISLGEEVLDKKQLLQISVVSKIPLMINVTVYNTKQKFLSNRP